MTNNKLNIKYIHFSFESFTLENFQKILIHNLKLNTTYSLLLKISGDNNLIFKMCGPQIGLVIAEEHDLNYYSKLYDLILTRIETTIDSYNYLDKIDGIEIAYSVIIPQKELTLKNISPFPFGFFNFNLKTYEVFNLVHLSGSLFSTLSNSFYLTIRENMTPAGVAAHSKV